MDEAMGNAPTEAVPFRAPPSTSRDVLDGPPHRRGSTAGRWLRAIAVFVVLGLIVGVLYHFGVGSRSVIAGPAQAATAPPPGQGESQARLGPVPVPPKPPSASFRFLATQTNKVTPVTWSPCRPIHYVVRPDHQLANGPQLIRAAIAAVSAATGLRFLDDGPTTEAPDFQRDAYQPQRYGDRWAPVLITWATTQEVPDFGVDVAGEAGPTWITTPAGERVNVTGSVALDPVKIADIQSRFGTKEAQAILLHEFGHLVGLQHVNDPHQIMYPRDTLAVMSYQRGDLTGLAKLGTGPCQPTV